MRNFKFQTGEYYHIYNRGIDKRNIFANKNDYIRFLISLNEFNNPSPVESLYRLKRIKESRIEKPLSGWRSHLEA